MKTLVPFAGLAALMTAYTLVNPSAPALLPLTRWLCSAIASPTRGISDWLFVDDHCRAILAVLDRGREGEVYNAGGSRSLPNRAVVEAILGIAGKPHSLMTTVKDRPGHDVRYALSSEKLTRETGWNPQVDFETGLALTVRWYAEHTDWIRSVKSGEYLAYYEENYAERLEAAR